MNQQTLQKMVNRFADDIRIAWNPVIERYQVLQTKDIISGFAVAGGGRWLRKHLMFTIETADGSFRLPDLNDLERVRRSVNSFHFMLDKGYDALADHFDNKDIAREGFLTESNADLVKQAAKELARFTFRKPTTSRVR